MTWAYPHRLGRASIQVGPLARLPDARRAGAKLPLEVSLGWGAAALAGALLAAVAPADLGPSLRTLLPGVAPQSASRPIANEAPRAPVARARTEAADRDAEAILRLLGDVAPAPLPTGFGPDLQRAAVPNPARETAPVVAIGPPGPDASGAPVPAKVAPVTDGGPGPDAPDPKAPAPIAAAPLEVVGAPPSPAPAEAAETARLPLRRPVRWTAQPGEPSAPRRTAPRPPTQTAPRGGEAAPFSLPRALQPIDP